MRNEVGGLKGQLRVSTSCSSPDRAFCRSDLSTALKVCIQELEEAVHKTG